MLPNFLLRCAAFGILCLAPLGCGGPAKGDLAGDVSYKGEKIPMGRITFQCQDGRMESYSSQILNGRYEIKGMLVGHAKITVETYGTAMAGGPKAPPKGLMIPPKDFEAMQSAKRLPIPEHYADLQKSGLSHDVAGGAHTKDFDLK